MKMTPTSLQPFLYAPLPLSLWPRGPFLRFCLLPFSSSLGRTQPPRLVSPAAPSPLHHPVPSRPPWSVFIAQPPLPSPRPAALPAHLLFIDGVL